jgi:general secretion pathway protein G
LRENRGFTLLEILVVIAILSILVAFVAPQFIGREDDARVTEAKVQIKSFETALNLFKIDNGFYPDTEQGLETLVDKPTTGKEAEKYRKGGYLMKRTLPKDPWGNPYIYISPGTEGNFEIISLGADGMEGGEDYDSDIRNWDID